MKKVNKYFLVDENGEILDETSEDGEVFTKLTIGDRVYRKSGEEETPRLRTIDMRFVKVNIHEIGRIGRKYPIFLRMIEYIQYQSNKLAFSNGKPINRQNLARVCGVCKNTVDTQLRGLIKEDVIKGVKDGRNCIYYVNPYIAHFGKQVYESVEKMFSSTIYKENRERLLGKGGKKR